MVDSLLECGLEVAFAQVCSHIVSAVHTVGQSEPLTSQEVLHNLSSP